MQIKGLTLGDFYNITDNVSRESYGGNIIVNPDAHSTPRGVTARLRADSSRGLGARRSASGRRSVAACWHAYRDVLGRLFDQFPEASVNTLMANYKGQEGFLRDYPATAGHNIGSMLRPATMPQLCECNDTRLVVAETPSLVPAPAGIVERIDAVLDEFDTVPQTGMRNAFRYTPTDEPYPF